MLRKENENKIIKQIRKERLTRKKCPKSPLIDSRNSRLRAALTDFRGGKRASEKIP